MASRTLTLVLAGDAKKMSRTMQRAGDDVEKFGAKTSRTFKRLAAAAAVSVIALGAGAASAVKDFAAFDNQVREVGTLVGDVSTKQLDALDDSIRAVARTFGEETGTVATAFYDSISAGVASADTAAAFAAQAAKFASAGATDISTGVDVLSSAINAYGLSAKDAEAVSDTFFATVRAGKTTVPELAAAFSQFGPTAAALGVELSDVNGWLAQLTLSGTPTKQAATQIKSALAEMAKPTSELAKQFERAAGTSFQQFIAAGGSLGEAMGLIGEQAQRSGKEMFEMTGSVEAAQALLGVTGANADRFAATLAAVGDSAGATDIAFGVMSDSISFRLSRLSALFTDFKLRVGAALVPVLEWAFDVAPVLVAQLRAVADGIRGDAMPAFERVQAFMAGPMVLAWRGVADRVRWLWGGLRRLTGNIVGPLREAHAKLVKFLVEKVSAAWAAVTGLVLVQWGALKELAAGVVERVTPALVSLRGELADRLGPALTAAADVLGETLGVADRLATVMREALSVAIVDHLIPALTAAGLALSLWFGGSIGRVVDLVLDLWDAYGAKLTPALEAVAEALGDAWDALTGWYESLTGGRQLVEDAAAAISAAWDGAATVVAEAAEQAEKAVGAAWDAVTAATAAAVPAVAADADAVAAAHESSSRDSTGSLAQLADFWRDHLLPALAAGADAALATLRELGRGVESVAHLMGIVWEAGVVVLGPVLKLAFNVVLEVLSTVLDIITGMFNVFTSLLTGDWSLFWFGLATILAAPVELIARIIGAFFGITEAEFNQWLDSMIAKFAAAWEAIRASTAAVWAAITSVVSAAVAVVTALVQTVLDKVQLAVDAVGAVAGVASGIGGFVGGIPSVIPGFASGGVVTRPTLAVVGEAGPEAIIPLSQLGGGGRQVVELNVTVQVEGSVISEGDLGAVVVETVQLAADRGELRFGVEADVTDLPALWGGSVEIDWADSGNVMTTRRAT